MESVICRRDEHVMVLTLNRQDKLNALTQEMYARLCKGLLDAEEDEQIRAVLIQGSDNCFCAGNDLDDFLETEVAENNRPVHQFIRLLPTLNKPLVAAVSGAAVGIGTTMLLHCDLVYCSDKTRFSLPFVNIGLVPEAASSLLLPLRIGRAQAAELLLLGKAFDGDKAYQLGLVNKVLPRDEVLPFALAQAQALAAQPPKALQATKALLKANRPSVDAAMNAEDVAFSAALIGDEAKPLLAAIRNR
ncbi:enoyl-CoA hydratase-related protein [Ferrimonas lipolytica]|uniref:Enoyl-CoA hydratase n=1 Tax=Ferrimonas lipolytica TaxID=2724191 RepID=A0A6H1UGM3_9GAMM|nr:enoyl-CoA hydratase-related protein [Ferrimonas lipolytica]QIZ77779.1 enoyl-CoA hydratase [Ferrimonas lipolytica]